MADALNDVLRKVDVRTGEVSTFAGIRPVNDESRPGWADGKGTSASFRTPRGLSRDGDSFLVSDSNNSLLRRVTIADATVTTAAGERGRYGIRAGALPGVLYEPQGLLRLEDGSLLVTHLTGILRIRGLE